MKKVERDIDKYITGPPVLTIKDENGKVVPYEPKELFCPDFPTSTSLTKPHLSSQKDDDNDFDIVNIDMSQVEEEIMMMEQSQKQEMVRRKFTGFLEDTDNESDGEKEEDEDM